MPVKFDNDSLPHSRPVNYMDRAHFLGLNKLCRTVDRTPAYVIKRKPDSNYWSYINYALFSCLFILFILCVNFNLTCH